MKDPSSIVSIRIPQKYKEKLIEKAEQENITVNTIVGKMIQDQMDWREYAESIGFVLVTKALLKLLIQDSNESKLLKIAEENKTTIKNVIKYINGEVNLDTFLRTLNLWLHNNHLPFRYTVKDSTIQYVIHHEMGKKWSKYLHHLNSSILNDIGHATMNEEIEDDTLAFEICKIATTIEKN